MVEELIYETDQMSRVRVYLEAHKYTKEQINKAKDGYNLIMLVMRTIERNNVT